MTESGVIYPLYNWFVYNFSSERMIRCSVGFAQKMLTPASLILVHYVILYFWVRKNAECRISCIWLKSLLNSASNEPGVSIF